MKQFFDTFALPNPGPPRELLDLVIGQTGASAVRRSLRLNFGPSGGQSTGLVEHLEDWLKAPGPGNVFWHPTIGQLKEKSEAGDDDIPLKLLIETGFLSQLDGAPGRWNFHLEQPQRLWTGRWLLPEIASGEVSGDGNSVHIDFSAGDGTRGYLSLSRDPQTREWVASHLPQNTFELPTVEFTPLHRILLLPKEMVDVELLPGYPGAEFQQAEELGRFADLLKQTADLLAQHAPDYLNWVAEVVRFVAPVVVPADLIGSSSSPAHSGLISIAEDPRPLAIAELLVHEASHQYFFIAECLGEVETGSAGRLFHSRFARRDRPLARILLAYHALANMTLFYERCLADGVPCEKRMAYISTHMRELNETLHEAGTFTDLGRALWMPLSEKTQHINMKADDPIGDAVLAEADRVMAELKGAALKAER